MKFLLLFSLLIFLSCSESTIHGDYLPVTFSSEEISNRTYLLRVPSSYNKSIPIPLVIIIHGYTGSGNIIEQYSQFTTKANAAGFIAVYPDGTGSPRQWNIGLKIDSYDNKSDDVGFISLLIDTISSNYNVDPRRIFVIGHSNGGEMAYRLALELPNKICAAASVAGSYLYHYSLPTNTMPIIHFHGLSDNIVPYTGDDYSRPIESVMEIWAENNGCEKTPVIIYQNEKTQCRKWASSNGNDVILYTINNWGHSWPNSDVGMSVADIAWDFFKAHPRQ